MRIELNDVLPVDGKALVELEEPVTQTESGLHFVRQKQPKTYRLEDDYEIGTVVAIGAKGWVDPAWAPLMAGDRVMVRALSGGQAGSDIGGLLGRGSGEVIIVDREEVLCIMQEE